MSYNDLVVLCAKLPRFPMKIGSIVCRKQVGHKYGQLSAENMAKEWVILAAESFDNELWYRCNSVSNIALVGQKDEWDKTRTIKTDSAIFLPEELVDTGRVYPL